MQLSLSYCFHTYTFPCILGVRAKIHSHAMIWNKQSPSVDGCRVPSSMVSCSSLQFFFSRFAASASRASRGSYSPATCLRWAFLESCINSCPSIQSLFFVLHKVTSSLKRNLSECRRNATCDIQALSYSLMTSSILLCWGSFPHTRPVLPLTLIATGWAPLGILPGQDIALRNQYQGS